VDTLNAQHAQGVAAVAKAEVAEHLHRNGDAISRMMLSSLRPHHRVFGVRPRANNVSTYMYRSSAYGLCTSMEVCRMTATDPACAKSPDRELDTAGSGADGLVRLLHAAALGLVLASWTVPLVELSWRGGERHAS
jgi:hypothetical protein